MRRLSDSNKPGSTISGGRNAQALRRDNEFNALKARVAELENRVNDIEGARQRLYEENDTLRAAVRKDGDTLRQEMVQMQGLIRAVETARAKDRQEIIDILSKRMSELIAQQQKAPVYQRGREHTVQQGETLSEIARAYGVTVTVIVNANKTLKSVDTIIRPGDKLFIPE